MGQQSVPPTWPPPPKWPCVRWGVKLYSDSLTPTWPRWAAARFVGTIVWRQQYTQRVQTDRRMYCQITWRDGAMCRRRIGGTEHCDSRWRRTPDCSKLRTAEDQGRTPEERRHRVRRLVTGAGQAWQIPPPKWPTVYCVVWGVKLYSLTRQAWQTACDFPDRNGTRIVVCQSRQTRTGDAGAGPHGQLCRRRPSADRSTVISTVTCL